jgi:hypothetical protein
VCYNAVMIYTEEMTVTKLERFLKEHGYNIAAVSRAIGLKSRSDFYNRMTERVHDGRVFHFTDEQKRKLAEYLRVDIGEIF